MQQLDIKKSIKINESRDIDEIEEVLNSILYVPDRRLKPKIIEELIKYLNSIFLEEKNKIKIYIVLIYKYNDYYSENTYWHINIYERVGPYELKFFKSIHKTL